MILNDANITQWCLNKRMIEPFNPMLVNPASYDLTLHYELIEITPGGIMDSSNSGNASHKLTSERKIKLSYGQNYLLQPGVFILASSVERVRIPPTLAAEVKLKSTTARKGIGHVYSGWIDPGFDGQITFELFSHVPVLLEPGKPIAQIIFNEMIQVPQEPYQGRYQHQEGPTPARSDNPEPLKVEGYHAGGLDYISAKDIMESSPALRAEANRAFNIIPPSVDQVWTDKEGNVHVKEPHDGREHILLIKDIMDNLSKHNIHPAQTVAEFIESIVNPKKAVTIEEAEANIQEVVDALNEDFGPGQINFDIVPNVNTGFVDAPSKSWADSDGKPLDNWAKRPIQRIDRDWAEETDL